MQRVQQTYRAHRDVRCQRRAWRETVISAGSRHLHKSAYTRHVTCTVRDTAYPVTKQRQSRYRHRDQETLSVERRLNFSFALKFLTETKPDP